MRQVNFVCRCILAFAMGMLTLWLPAKIQEATKVNELLACNLICVDVHSLPLAGQEVGCIDGASTAAIHSIKGIPAAQTYADVSERKRFGTSDIQCWS